MILRVATISKVDRCVVRNETERSRALSFSLCADEGKTEGGIAGVDWLVLSDIKM